MTLYCIFILILLSSRVQAETMNTDTNQNDGVKEYYIDEVTISGSRDKATYHGWSDSLDMKALERHPAKTIEHLLSRTASLNIRSYGVSGSALASYRGMGSGHSRLYWNGLNLNTSTHGSSDLSLFPIFFIDEAGLEHSSHSLYAGVGALGGNIHLNNNRIIELSNRAGLYLSTASYGNHSSGIDIKWGNDHLAFRSRLFYKRAENDFIYKNSAKAGQPEERLEHAAMEQYGYLQEVAYKFSEYSLLSAKLWLHDSERQIPATMVVSNSDQKQYDRSLRSVLSWMFNQNVFNFKLNAGYNREKLRFISPRADVDSETEANSLQLSSQASYRFSEKLNLRFTFNARHDRAYTEDFLEQAEQQQLNSGAGLDYQITDRLSSGFLIRIGYGYTGMHPVLPALSINYQLINRENTNLKLSLSAAENFNEPTLNDRFWLHSGVADLKPEQGRMVDFSLTFDHKLKRTKLNLRSAVFAANVENWILWKPGSGSLWHPENVDRVVSRGIETSASIEFASDNWQAEAYINYSYTIVTNDTVEDWKKVMQSYRMVYTPDHEFSAGGYLYYRNLYLTTDFQFTGIRYIHRDNSYYMPAYALFNAGTGANFNMNNHLLNLQFMIYNITDKNYQPLPWRPAAGRNYEVTLRYMFQ